MMVMLWHDCALLEVDAESGLRIGRENFVKFEPFLVNLPQIQGYLELPVCLLQAPGRERIENN